MTDKDLKLIKALIRGTEEQKIKWDAVKAHAYKEFKETGENIEQAYYFSDNKLFRNILIYKATSSITDGFGEEVERSNVHLIFGMMNSFRVNFKISDYELSNSALLWSLYKLVQRSESGANELIDDLIKEYGDDDDDIPF